MHRCKLQLEASVLLLLLSLSSPGQAQSYSGEVTVPVYPEAQLDQMLAPVALYPDPLLGQVLMAATYPLEIVEAERWLKNPGNASLRGDQLAYAMEQQPWDPSVKSLVGIPPVLHMLDANIQWTEQLGDAFIAQQAPVMDSIQRLRQQAAATGALTSSPQEVVTQQGSAIVIEPANPQLVYVPTYNPNDVYGPWPYADYPPYYFNPGYAYNGALIGFGAGIVVGDVLWGWDRWDWRSHRIDLDNRRFASLNNGRPPESNGVWHYDPDHRHGVPYRDPATRAQYQGAGSSPEVQRGFRGYNGGTPTPSPATRPNAGPTHINAPAERPSYRQATPVGVPEQRQQYHQPPTPMAAPAERPADRPATPVGVQEQREQFQQRSMPRASIERPMEQHMPQATPQMQHVEAPRPPAPLVESFSRGEDVRAQSARGAASRAEPVYAPPPPAPSPAPAPVANHPNGGEATPNRGERR